jgi:hypothetical protein
VRQRLVRDLTAAFEVRSVVGLRFLRPIDVGAQLTLIRPMIVPAEANERFGHERTYHAEECTRRKSSELVLPLAFDSDSATYPPLQFLPLFGLHNHEFSSGAGCESSARSRTGSG